MGIYKLTTMTRLVSFLMLLSSMVMVNTKTKRDSNCSCINPFLGKITDVNGDPDDMCTNIEVCYVDCNSKCGDGKFAKGVGRCYSRKACEGRGNNGVTYRDGDTTPQWGRK